MARTKRKKKALPQISALERYGKGEFLKLFRHFEKAKKIGQKVAIKWSRLSPERKQFYLDLIEEEYLGYDRPFHSFLPTDAMVCQIWPKDKFLECFT